MEFDKFENSNDFLDNFQLNETNKYTGHVNIKNFNGVPFELFQNLGIDNGNDFEDSVSKDKSKTNLSKTYFSRENIEYLHKKIILGVYEQSQYKYKIGKQSEDELKIVMKSIYLQYGQNLDCKIKEQVNSLNKRVLKYCINNIILGIKQYIGYVEDVSSDIKLMDRPILTSNAGEKILQPDVGFTRFSSKR